MLEFILVEQNKVEAPSLLLADFNYFINKAIYQYLNKRYAFYDLSLQTTDDLRVLTAKLVINAPTFNGEYYIDSLPSNYFHILNCICKFTALVDNGCYDKDDTVSYSARKLTADMWPQIINNYYYLPTYKRPYYYIQDNMSIEFRCGARDKFELTRVDIDYLEAPQTINITQNQLDNLTDTSQTIEFPDYVCYEIINEAVKLILENSSDPRLQTNIPINQSILSPFPMMQQQS